MQEPLATHPSTPAPEPPCAGAKICPISSSPCPGDCIYAAILASMSLGVVVFDLAHGSLAFANRWAQLAFSRVGVTVDYKRLSRLLLPAAPHTSGSALRPEPLRFGERIFGYTVYRANDVAWVFIRDITEKTRLEAIAAAVESTNNIGYVFSAVRHEIGNPINSVKVALGVLGANLDTFPRETIADYVQRMSTEIGRIERLLRTLRSFSAYERPDVESVELGPFFEDFLALVELFGWERGAFTGAVGSHEGAFGMADGGTLFLDEIGELPLHLQPKLLAALEDHVVRRIGGRASRQLDVRVIAATNADLPQLVAEKRFRADLYYRLDVVHIRVPPLRERPDDIPALARHLLAGFRRRGAAPGIQDSELAGLAAYAWPGNVRELRNVLERAVLLGQVPLGPTHLLGAAPAAPPTTISPLAEVERRHITLALQHTGGNLAHSARLLGISLSTLKRRVRGDRD